MEGAHVPILQVGISGFPTPYAICRSGRRVLEYRDQNYWNH